MATLFVEEDTVAAPEDEVDGFESDQYEFAQGPANKYHETVWQDVSAHDDVHCRERNNEIMQRLREMEAKLGGARSDLQAQSCLAKAE